MQYAGFWRRLCAHFIDILILLPIVAFGFWGNEVSRLFQLYYFLPGILFSLWYSVYLVERYGGTPGKLLMKIRIVRTDGTAVGRKEAFLRCSVYLLLSVLGQIALILAALQMSDELYHSLGFLKRAIETSARTPWWYSYVNVLLQVWVWSEFVTMLTNKKRRAIHDFMAGTVVVRA